jgi:hypothetical protein
VPAPFASDLVDWFKSLRITNLSLDDLRPILDDLGVIDLPSLMYVHQEKLLSRDTLVQAKIKVAQAGLFIAAVTKVCVCVARIPTCPLILSSSQLVNTTPPSGVIPSTLPPPTASATTAQPPQDPPDIFILLRFAEALEEAKALKAALAACGANVFLCAVDPGASINKAIITALESSRLVVILATRTYGKETGFPCSTYEELEYIVGHKKPFFLVKMCDEYQEPHAKFHLPVTTMHYLGQPQTPQERTCVPPQLLVEIMQKLSTVPGRRLSTSASSTFVPHSG